MAAREYFDQAEMKHKILGWITKHRRARWIRRLDGLALQFHAAFENFDYDFSKNGENRILKKIGDACEVRTVLDVGANVGDWSLLASANFPKATIYSFEIVPETFERLRVNCSGRKNIFPINVGLSDSDGTVSVFYSPEKPGLATCIPTFSERFHKYQPQVIEASVKTGDAFCSRADIQVVDFLKIDVEGLEHKVLKGFETMLGEGRIKVIQFEYGFININTHFLLKDFYDYLSSFNFTIGKVYPASVEFKEYSYTDENFYGPNYLAVHQSHVDLINILNGTN